MNIIEFLLWDNCNNHCKFCFLKGNDGKCILDDNKKAQSINLVNDHIHTLNNCDILLCGGELFDTKFSDKTNNCFVTMIDTIIKKLKNNDIRYVYVNTNLIYDMDIQLIEFLNKFRCNNLIDRLKFTTSYDLVGRYKDSYSEKLFIDNVHRLRVEYPNMKIIANMVLTKQVCNLILNNDISIKDLQDSLDVDINTIPYIILLDSMAPTKELVMDTLLHINNEIPGYLNTYIKRFTIDQKRVLFKFLGDSLVELTSDTNKCNHSVNFTQYTKEGSCFICDLEDLYGKIS